MSARIALALAALALGLAGCLSAGTREAPRFYVLEVPQSRAYETKETRRTTLVVQPTSASSFYDSTDIVYSRAPGTRAYYQYASWTEPPNRRIGALLLERLAASGAFERVAPAGDASGALLLRTHLEELYHDAASPPGNARVVLRAELIDPARRTVVAQRTFTRVVPAATYDAPGAVQAMRTAVGAILDDVAAWVDATAAR
jgi:cholesterol transport system auxiliary component